MKLRWTEKQIDGGFLDGVQSSLNSKPWRGFDAESVLLGVVSVVPGDDGWTATVEVVPTRDDVPGFSMYGRIDLNDVVPASAIDIDLPQTITEQFSDLDWKYYERLRLPMIWQREMRDDALSFLVESGRRCDTHRPHRFYYLGEL